MFKKIVSQFVSPLPVICLLMLAGLFYLFFTRKQAWGKFLLFAGAIILLLLSNGHISDNITGYLESSYKPHAVQFSHEFYDSEDEEFIKFIVVLGGGHSSNPELPLTSQISTQTMVRLIEGIRIYRKHIGSKLILSGGSAFDPVPDAVLMADIAGELGVSEHDIILESESKDTKDEAVLIRPIVGVEKFFLVTSAAHMHRSIAMFQKLGMNPVPAPVGHMFNDVKRKTFLSYFPGSGNLDKSSRAIHEYLGMVWASLRGQI
jgi:uncharacterized SAM-binding protein YcdF (DUF218 family)